MPFEAVPPGPNPFPIAVPSHGILGPRGEPPTGIGDCRGSGLPPMKFDCQAMLGPVLGARGPEVRAERRYRELLAKGVSADPDQVLAETISRDEQDSTRADSPLMYDASYTVIDTSDLSVDEVVDAIVAKTR